MAGDQVLYISKCLFIMIILITNFSSGFFIRQQSVLTDIEPTEPQQRPDIQRKNLIEILQNLQQFNFKEEKRSLDTESAFQLNTERRQMDSSVDKRDYGIMPPWNEMCRMMRIAFCVRHKR